MSSKRILIEIFTACGSNITCSELFRWQCTFNNCKRAIVSK